MKIKPLFAVLLCIFSTTLMSSQSFLQKWDGADREVPRLPVRSDAPKPAASRNTLENAGSAAPQKVETPMATDERLERDGWWPTKRSASFQDFVGTSECARCHAKKANSQRATPMAQASIPAAGSVVLREHERLSLRSGPYDYAISHNDARHDYSVSDGVSSISEPLAWAFGLGNKGQTYIYQMGALFIESRMSFYKTLQGLDLTTGHSGSSPRNLADALGRPLDPESLRRCFGCHTTASSTADGFNPSRATPGVACEACHGPGAKHVILMDEDSREEGRQTIFNPGRLSAVGLVDFCGACHRTWNDVNEMGLLGVANVRFQPYRLENSRCWGDGDARLACIACHDPHQQLNHSAEDYDVKCLSCHVLAPTKKTSLDHPGKPCPVGRKNCVNCHMPHVALPSMHAPFVDHQIRIVRPNAPYPN
jgi:hypothetical protein